ncbi:MAG: veratrol--corrinoid protein metyltransferase [Clostridiales bacterium]|nr:veratrol--corrinoid protein metyltransferase [Clostridiales bacterium]
MLTEKDNYMRIMRGEMPEFVPVFNYAGLVIPSIINQNRKSDMSGFDCFGVEFVPTADGIGAVPAPGKFMINDITKWRDIVTLPDLSNVDWEAMAKKDLEKIDRSKAFVMGNYITGFFQTLINYMGFTEGLCACSEEPEEVIALMEWVTDFYMIIGKNMIKYYKPDMVWLPDDVATARSPFISLTMFRELFSPYWRKYVELFLDAGIPTQLHCCGQCEILIQDWIDMGITAWDPVQTANDIDAIKTKYGRKLALVGGFDASGRVADPDATEEEIRSEVRKYADRLAPDGGFVFSASVSGPFDQREHQKRNAWIMDEYKNYVRDYYQTIPAIK